MTQGLGDGEILSGTVRRTNEEGRAQFVFAFPNGQEMTSPWMSEEQERRAIIGWCENVRAEYGNQMPVRSRTASPKRATPEPVAPDSAVPAKGKPHELVREMVSELTKAKAALEDEIKAKEETLGSVTEDLEVWLKVAKGIGIDDTVSELHTQEQVREVPTGEEETGDVGGDG